MTIKYDNFQLEKGSQIYVAFFDENKDLDLDSTQLTKSDIQRLSQITGVHRRKELLFVRNLLSAILPNEEIAYEKNGAPYLCSKSRNISISHSLKCVAIMLSDGKCGLDIEQIDRNFRKISSRLLTSKDIYIETDKDLAMAWTSKEALFKAFSSDNLEIFSDINICSIEESGTICKVRGEEIVVQIFTHNEHLIAGVENF